MIKVVTVTVAIFRIVDRPSGACVLRLRNLIPNRSSLLVKIQLVRIRSLVVHTRINFTSKTERSLPQVFLHLLQNRQGKFFKAGKFSKYDDRKKR